MTARLADEVAIVTGSTSGLGKVIGEVFAAEGASVLITGRNAERGAAIEANIGKAGGHAFFLAADLTDPAAPERLVASTTERFGRLTVVVNSAVSSSGGDGPVGDVESARWDELLRVNLSAVAWMCRAAIPAMRKAGHGSIVNVSSRAGERGTPGLAAYAASKGGMNALTRSIAVDYAADGIRCNTVSPGYVLHEARDRALSRERRARLAGMHLTRLAEPHDVAWAAVYLASREAEVVTGITLRVDGGSTAARGLVLG
jgi:NAD(P)-dependent dehydrogenase (short-subunit alcohol dehydrogenase family)